MIFDNLNDCNVKYNKLEKNMIRQMEKNDELNIKIKNLKEDNYKLFKKLKKPVVNIVTPESSTHSQSLSNKSHYNESQTLHLSPENSETMMQIPPPPTRISRSLNNESFQPPLQRRNKIMNPSLHKTDLPPPETPPPPPERRSSVTISQLKKGYRKSSSKKSPSRGGLHKYRSRHTKRRYRKTQKRHK